MNKKKLILSMLPIFATTLAVATVIGQKDSLFANADEQTYSLTINETPSGLPTSSFGTTFATYQTNLGNDYPVTFGNAKDDGDFVTLTSGGYIQAMITGVKTVTVSFDGELALYGKVFNDEAFVKIGDLTSGTAFSLTYTVDYISLMASSVTKVENIACTYSCATSGLNETIVRYEAEDVLVRPTDWNFENIVWNDAKASGGKITGNLWNGITYRIQHNAKVAGSHEFQLFYVNGTAGQSVTMSVNGQASFQVSVEPKVVGSWDINNRTTVSTMINLRKGYNDIYITCTGDAHAQYDCFDILPNSDENTYNPYAVSQFATQADLFAIAAKTNNGCNRGNDWGSPYYAGCGMGLGDSVSNYFVCDFNNMQAGNYKLVLEYGSDTARTFNLVINDTDTVNVTLPSSGAWNNLATNSADINVTLVEGANAIKIPNPGGWININKISLTYAD
ncbi:MAG: hypothetical protein HUJ59_00155 [Bacilli bacterium]|nr:hypothetical protein [Bacilli bacterium]